MVIKCMHKWTGEIVNFIIKRACFFFVNQEKDIFDGKMKGIKLFSVSMKCKTK